MTMDNATRPGGNSAGRTILFVGLALGVATAVMIALILRSNDNDGETRIVPATRLAVVARQDIPARTRLTRELLEVKTYDIDEIDPDAFSSVNQVLNRVTTTDVKGGAAVVPAFVSATAGEGLSFTVAEGKRAISVTVDGEVEIAGGNLVPGSRVDVLGILDVGAGGSIRAGDVTGFLNQFTSVPRAPVIAPEGSRLTFTILQDVRVLAVAQVLPPEAGAPTAQQRQQGGTSFTDTANTTAAAAPNPSAATVTLEVTPQQAEVMVTADLTVTLRFAVRGFGDSTLVDTVPIIIQVR